MIYKCVCDDQIKGSIGYSRYTTYVIESRGEKYTSAASKDRCDSGSHSRRSSRAPRVKLLNWQMLSGGSICIASRYVAGLNTKRQELDLGIRIHLWRSPTPWNIVRHLKKSAEMVEGMKSG